MRNALEMLISQAAKALTRTRDERMIEGFLSELGEFLHCRSIAVSCDDDAGRYRYGLYWNHDEGVNAVTSYAEASKHGLDIWQQFLETKGVFVTDDVDSIADEDPAVYHVLKQAGVQSVVGFTLDFMGANFGFVIIADPQNLNLFEDDLVLAGIRFVIASLICGNDMRRQLDQQGYTDEVSGAGNKMGLRHRIERMDRSGSVGFVCCGVCGMDDTGHRVHMEQTLIHAESVLQSVFGNDAVFRIDSTDFLVLDTDDDRTAFGAELDFAIRLMQERGIDAAFGSRFAEECGESLNELIDAAVRDMRQEKERMLQQGRIHDDGSDDEGRTQDHRATILLPQGEDFFRGAEQWISTIFDHDVAAIAVDINFFRLYNDIFGWQSGNDLLEKTAATVDEVARRFQGVGGYVGNDDFCLLLPVPIGSDAALVQIVDQVVDAFDCPDGFAHIFGVCRPTGFCSSAIAMYDHAAAAMAQIKGSYAKRCGFYDAERFQGIKEAKMLQVEAKHGLQNGEFLFYLQPKVNEGTGLIVGAEALARWNRNGRIVGPDVFIGEMEHSGLVYSLDRFIWEEVCKWQRNLIDRGIAPLPVSVNVSRVDFYFADVAQELIGLVEKYGIDPSLINVEITETALSENLDDLRDVIVRLREHGFFVFLDDFGSGSSSLSMLHALDIDGIKTDIHFLNQMGQDDRASSIVESVISMAHMIGLVVVAEGVERQVQRDTLLSMGDTYAQGNYFYEPMPAEAYERLLCDPTKLGVPLHAKKPLFRCKLHFRDMVYEGILNDTVLDSIVGAAAVYREEGDVISIVQMNKAFSDLTGIDADDRKAMEKFIRLYCQGDAAVLRKAFREADHSLEGRPVKARFHRSDGNTIKLEGRIFLLYTFEKRRLYLSTVNS
ncbi:Bacteriophytochrome cph2 [Slackia heliotrinireducens]|uniref:EAL domain-containing protein n=1 Tax=Slackia heliotrinireducens (strain ATCC 29202 / DSM 20476 / NCTC 11029 / RHS 1) TaxID=471855 RepID=C7N1Z5_SLAHD|nr:bifunctional diguanylate cyclase/phosphodiesterase [Slackia heliotrinireducens]ACV23436.1 EAL domain-containing protein [Slackia heliotrinireducens DSM 20476]VEH02740.1 Bacteriophytochrome cph2 [Slackia heliotrinireducens]